MLKLVKTNLWISKCHSNFNNKDLHNKLIILDNSLNLKCKINNNMHHKINNNLDLKISNNLCHNNNSLLYLKTLNSFFYNNSNRSNFKECNTNNRNNSKVSNNKDINNIKNEMKINCLKSKFFFNYLFIQFCLI